MKERPILFSAPMVRAILAGTKLQTRRAAKGVNFVSSGGAPLNFTDDDIKAVPCPYGQPGDRLWVREAWSHDAESLDHCRASAEDAMGGGAYGPYYRATEVAPDTLSWKPSIHMPRWASRIMLEITGVRIERLQDISKADALAEGVEAWRAGWDEKTAATAFLHGTQARTKTNDGAIAQRLYYLLWEQINGPGSWDVNPWVWVVEFKRIEQTA